MSKYIALLIETLNYDNSISRLLDPVDRIHKAVEEYKSNAIVADKNFKGTTSIFNTCAWNIKDTAIRVDGGNVNLSGGTILHGGQAGVYATGGKVSVAGMIIENRSYADIFATGGTEHICAFGNLPAKTPKYTIAGGVSVSGSDLK